MSQDYPFRGSETGYGQRDDYDEDTGTAYATGQREPPGGRSDATAAASELIRPEVMSLLETCGLDPGDLSALADLPEHLINIDTLPHLLKKLWESKKSKKSESPAASGSSHFAAAGSSRSGGGGGGGGGGVGSAPAFERVRLGTPPTTRSDRSAHDRPTRSGSYDRSSSATYDRPSLGSNDPRGRDTSRTDRDVDLRPGKYDWTTPGTSTYDRPTSDPQGRETSTGRDVDQRPGTRADSHSQPTRGGGRSTRDAYRDVDMRPGSYDRSTPANSLFDPHGRDDRAHHDIDQRPGVYDRPTSDIRSHARGSYDRPSYDNMYDRPTSATKSHDSHHGRDTWADRDVDQRSSSYDRPTTAGTSTPDRPTPANGSFDPHGGGNRTYRDVDLRPSSYDRTTPTNGMCDRPSPATSSTPCDPHDRETSTDSDISQRQGTSDRAASATGKNDRYHWTRDAGQQRTQFADDDDDGRGSLVTCVSKEESTPRHTMPSKKETCAAPHSQPTSGDRYHWTRDAGQQRKQSTDDDVDRRRTLVQCVSKEESTPHHAMPSKKEASDFHGRCPDGLPYTCSLCDYIVVINWDWIQHTNTAQHADNRLKLLQRYPAWDCHINSYRPDEERPVTSWQKTRTLIPLKRSSEPTEAPSNKRPKLEKTPEKTEENLLPEVICEPTTKTVVNLQVNDEALKVESGAPANSTSAAPCEKEKATQDEGATGEITSVPEQGKNARKEQPEQPPFVLVKSKQKQNRNQQRAAQWRARNAEAMGVGHEQKQEAEVRLPKSPVPMQQESQEGAGPHLSDVEGISSRGLLGNIRITRFFTYHPEKRRMQGMPLILDQGFLWSTIYWAEWCSDDDTLHADMMIKTGRNNLHLYPGDRESRRGRSTLMIDLQASSRPGLQRWSRPKNVPVNVKIWFDQTNKIPWAEVIDANNPDIWRILFLPDNLDKLPDHLE